MRNNLTRVAPRRTALAIVAALSGSVVGVNGALAADTFEATPLKDRSIAYVMTNKKWAVFQTPEAKGECPSGLNDGAREQFIELYPENGTQYTLRDTAMKREIAAWFPTTEKEPFE